MAGEIARPADQGVTEGAGVGPGQIAHRSVRWDHPHQIVQCGGRRVTFIRS
jgi:hypothetical protein